MRKKVYFISDLHLGASYGEDKNLRERRVVRFLDSIAADAEAIYLVGDILDYWFEYRYVVPKGFVRFFGKLAELSDSGAKITWMIGNHDIWIFDYLPDELGIEVIDGLLDREILGTRIVLEHGDGVWQRDWKYKMLRKVFRNKTCQKLFSGIHPRWTIPFALNWSSHSRKTGEQGVAKRNREISQSIKKGCYKGLPENIQALEEFSKDYIRRNGEVKYFIYGHLHHLLDKEISPGSRMLILGDWLTHFSYAEFDGEQMRLIPKWDGIRDKILQ